MNFLQRLLSQPKTEAEAQGTAAGKGMGQSDHDQPGRIGQLPPGLHVGKLSDIGQLRERNEDSFYTVQSLLQHNYGQEPFGLFIVADGMGGHQKGEIASSLAARTAAECILKDIYLPYLAENNRNAAARPINEVLIAAVENANSAVQEAAPDGGTTLTVALVMGNSAYIAHVGDTRAYWFNQGNLKQVTKDHSLVQRLVELGQETAEGALTHPQRNVLYRAIGQGGAMEVDIYVQHLPPGSSLLLCSDGLWGPVKNDALREIINTSATPQEACERLIATANKNGGEDNITAVMVSMGVEI
ncbi:MAG TPA: PP2C family serine/threonine-protein phosphatase [Anaerolineae bacterium]|nr:PP2C family serine/threonine-protein phosphatase [Anaerolineae bacterium]